MEPINQNVAIFTVCNIAYLPRALVLADSVFTHSGARLKIFLFDKKKDLRLAAINAELIWMEDLAVPNFHQLAMKYDIIEFSTSLKPYLTLLLLDTHERVIFFDPDICLYSSPLPILRDIDEHSILLTPHYTTPQSNDPSESDLGMMKFGSFNLGFFAVKRDKYSRAFLEWWSERCINFSFMEAQFGLSTDQKWVTIAPCLFRGICVSFNLGYNMAPWNSYERNAVKDGNGQYIVNEEFPLIFFHYSNFVGDDPQYLKKRAVVERGVYRADMLELGLAYKAKLEEKTSQVMHVPYSYDYFSGGEYISPTLRRAYASILPELPPHDPFDSSGVFFKFAKKNRLITRERSPYQRSGMADLKQNQGYLRVIYFAMRVALRILGPNKFFNFSRLLVFLSSYRQNRGLWTYSRK
jgi:hypothetical protein